ncbi:MAG: SIR22 domain-containing protein [Nitrospira sp.]|nr:MAG: SIR22 domain-containing protein [Nitrospira sp.]
MPVEIARLVDTITPEKTVILFGSGSSVPSGLPNASELADHLAKMIGLSSDDYSLSEIAGLVEQRTTRRELIDSIRSRLRGARPTGGLLNLPFYNWKSIYTTNYDDLIERSYQRVNHDLIVYSSDFDFTVHDNSQATKLFKLHGTIEKDIADGNSSRLILTETDYDQSGNYRNSLFDRLKGDMIGGHLVIIGQSLQDRDIRDLVNRAADLGSKAPGAWKLSLFLYIRDENRAQLFEKRGFTVCFGGIDDFFAELSRKLPTASNNNSSEDPLDLVPALRPVTVDVNHASTATANFEAMFNGWPATHSDILANLTFERTAAEEIDQLLREPDVLCTILLGASGVGKTTAARQAIQRLRQHSRLCWEHQIDHSLNVQAWVEVARALSIQSLNAILLIDEAHLHLQQINQLIEALTAEKHSSLKLICVSTRNHWNPRIKTPYLFKAGKVLKLGRLEAQEIDRLLNLVDSNSLVRTLVEKTFSGFSRHERRRRLVDRCESEMFVCLRNIFASEKFDDIILREYASLDGGYQEMYKIVAALESAGIRVHRQFVIRLLGIPADHVSAALANLTDIIHEYTINEREGLYGWRCRHHVIAAIIARYKFPQVQQLADLFSLVIDHLSPTYDVEVLSMRELCNVESGIPSIPDKQVQNTLLRKIISTVPGERVPRHRLIRNLIEMGEFEKAEMEIRIFEKDFRRDGPVARYKVALLTARARTTPGIMAEDRLAILEQARGLATTSIQQFPYNKSLLTAYCEVGLEIYRRTGNYTVHNDAIAQLRAAEDRIGDPDIPRLISRYESRLLGHQVVIAEDDSDAEATDSDE